MCRSTGVDKVCRKLKFFLIYICIKLTHFFEKIWWFFSPSNHSCHPFCVEIWNLVNLNASYKYNMPDVNCGPSSHWWLSLGLNLLTLCFLDVISWISHGYPSIWMKIIENIVNQWRMEIKGKRAQMDRGDIPYKNKKNWFEITVWFGLKILLLPGTGSVMLLWR